MKQDYSISVIVEIEWPQPNGTARDIVKTELGVIADSATHALDFVLEGINDRYNVIHAEANITVTHIDIIPMDER